MLTFQLPSQEPPVKETPVVSIKEKLKSLREGPGSMTAYLQLRERERLQDQQETPPPEVQAELIQSQSGMSFILVLMFVLSLNFG